MEKKCPNVALVTFPIGDSGFTPLLNLISILKSLSNHLHLVTGNTGYDLVKENNQIHTYEIKHKKGKNILSRVAKYVLTQLKFIPVLIKISKDLDFFVFFFGGESLLFPMLTAKFLGKKVVLVLAASSVDISKARKDIFLRFLALLKQLNCGLANRIVVASNRQISEFKLEKYKNKISIALEHFVNFEEFKVERAFSERKDIVGFIGRLSEEKGILNFVGAIPRLIQTEKAIKFLIGGDGPLHGKVQEYLNKKDLKDKVIVAGWISHERLPKYLNELKLIVVPSYTETGPLIAFEAMACGTLVLGSQVGLMPVILRDGKNGFLLKNNSPELIARSVFDILIREDLEEISSTARKTVEKKLAYDCAVKGYKTVFKLLGEKKF